MVSSRAVPQHTRGFVDVAELRHHFAEHGDDFRASNATEYEEFADIFLGSAKVEGIRECTRRCGHIIRYDPSTEAFGVLDVDGVILTCYKPVPCAQVPFAERERVRLRGRCHKYPSNSIYFERECNK